MTSKYKHFLSDKQHREKIIKSYNKATPLNPAIINKIDKFEHNIVKYARSQGHNLEGVQGLWDQTNIHHIMKHDTLIPTIEAFKSLRRMRIQTFNKQRALYKKMYNKIIERWTPTCQNYSPQCDYIATPNCWKMPWTIPKKGAPLTYGTVTNVAHSTHSSKITLNNVQGTIRVGQVISGPNLRIGYVKVDSRDSTTVINTNMNVNTSTADDTNSVSIGQKLHFSEHVPWINRPGVEITCRPEALNNSNDPPTCNKPGVFPTTQMQDVHPINCDFFGNVELNSENNEPGKACSDFISAIPGIDQVELDYKNRLLTEVEKICPQYCNQRCGDDPPDMCSEIPCDMQRHQCIPSIKKNESIPEYKCVVNVPCTVPTDYTANNNNSCTGTLPYPRSYNDGQALHPNITDCNDWYLRNQEIFPKTRANCPQGCTFVPGEDNIQKLSPAAMFYSNTCNTDTSGKYSYCQPNPYNTNIKPTTCTGSLSDHQDYCILGGGDLGVRKIFMGTDTELTNESTCTNYGTCENCNYATATFCSLSSATCPPGNRDSPVTGDNIIVRDNDGQIKVGMNVQNTSNTIALNTTVSSVQTCSGFLIFTIAIK